MLRRWDAIVAGGGLGGLCTAAFLSRAGRKVLVLEQAPNVGGVCSGRTFDGFTFDAGANYFGRRILKIFRELGERQPFEVMPIAGQGVIQDLVVSHPFGAHTVQEFSALGLTFPEMLRTLGRLYGQLFMDRYGDSPNAHEVIRKVARHKLLEEFFHLEAFLLGTLPDRMPANLFNTVFGSYYGYDFPFYPRGGSQDIPEAFARIIRAHGGEVRTGAGVDRVLCQNGAIQGVESGGEVLEADVVVSNMGPQRTARSLQGADRLYQGAEPEALPAGLHFSTLFMILDPAARVRPGLHTLVGGSPDLKSSLESLWEGQFPDEAPFCFTCPDVLEDPKRREGGLRATLRFLTPAGQNDPVELYREACRVLELVDWVIPGLSDGIRWWKLVTSPDYPRQVGFSGCLSPVLEWVGVEKLPSRTAVRGLYLAGATIEAPGCHTGSAVESGRRCARHVLADTQKTWRKAG